MRSRQEPISSSSAKPMSSSSFGLRGVRSSLRRPLSASCSVLLALIIGQNYIQTIDCLQTQGQQQQGSVAQQQPSGANQQLARQQGGGFDFGQSAGLADNMINLGQTNGYLNNNKRARKMSAFMPMRGRKDGRDFEWPPQQAPETIGGYLPMMRESDGSDERILRLAIAAAAANQALGGGVATPRSFVDQMMARRAAQQQQPIGEVAPEPSGASNFILGDSGGSPFSADSGQPAVMQAKLRRAFHPMRGKKSDSSWLTLDLFGDQFDQDLDQTM